MYWLQLWRESFTFLKPHKVKYLLKATGTTLYRYRNFFGSMFFLYILFDNGIWKYFFGLNFPSFNDVRHGLMANLLFIFLWRVKPFLGIPPRETPARDCSLHFVYWFFIPLLFYPFLRRVVYSVVSPKNFLILFLPFESFFILSWLESSVSIKSTLSSLWRALNIYVFNFPFLFISFMIPAYLISFLGFVMPTWFKYIKLFFLLFYTAFFASFYIEWLYRKFR